MDNYFDRPELSHSDLMLINKSIEHYLCKGNFESTDAMDIGSAFHCFILENHKFNDLYIVKPEGLALNTIEGMLWKEFNLIEKYDNSTLINSIMAHFLNPKEFYATYIFKPSDIKLNTKDGKQWALEHIDFKIISEKEMDIVNSFEIEKSVLQDYLSNYNRYINSDKVIISYEDFKWFELMQRKITDHPLNYLLQGENIEVEKELYFEYEGVKCRSKLDYINHDLKIIFDFKTISDCSKAESECKFRYCSQAYFYQVACYENFGEIYRCIDIFAEKSYPHGIKFCEFGAETLNAGANKIHKAIDKYKIYRTGTDLGYKEYIGYSDKLIEV